jgi:hypothetical protein
VHAISSEEEGRAPSDLDQTAAYRFGRAWPGQATDLGRLGRRLPPRPTFFFLAIRFFLFAKCLLGSKMCRNYSVYSKIVFQISMKSLYCMLTNPTACVILGALNIFL